MTERGESSPTLGELVQGKGWRTGAVVPHAIVRALQPYLTRPDGTPIKVGPEDWLVVVSQTCDVVAKDLDQEPCVEVLHCRPIPKLRPQFKELRSTRRLDFRPNRQTHADLALNAHAVADRYLLPRDILRNHAPDSARRLDPIATKRILAWFSLRYGRPAWPDAFVRRIGRKSKDVLETALEPLKDDIAQVRVAIIPNDQELPLAQDYKVAVYFIVSEEIWESDPESRKIIYKAFNEYVATLAGCEGIQVNQELSGVVSGGEFSWQQTQLTDEWNFANLSHREI
jgi:hypothetical protein